MCRWLGARLVWAGSNFIVFVCMAGTALISLVSVRQYSGVQHGIGANETTKIASLVVFAILGIPLAVSVLSNTSPQLVVFFFLLYKIAISKDMIAAPVSH